MCFLHFQVRAEAVGGGRFIVFFMTKIQFLHSYQDTISIENLLEAWKEFLVGKRGRKDVQEFQRNLMDNILQLHRELASKTYKHSPYEAFNISDPKPRNIHKASVRDRLLHHAIYRKLYLLFDRTFIPDSYSCRNNKGTHKAIARFKYFANKVSKNSTKVVWVLKCDIKKFFASVDQRILMNILKQYISDVEILELLSRILKSFNSDKKEVGLPLGNLTSQLFVNIYMNEFDQFVKHKLKVKYYIRYADDFVLLHQDRGWLEDQVYKIDGFLEERLKLQLHPKKVSIETFASGVDFLGWICFPTHKVIRTKTKNRMFKKLNIESSDNALNSYLGLLKHGNAYKVEREVIKRYLLIQQQREELSTETETKVN